MQDIYQKEKREKQHRAWTRLIRVIPNKLNLSLPMPKVIPTILTKFDDVWQTYKQIWYVPFIWSFMWYSYWIIFDSVVWDKPLVQLNLLNCIGATTSAIFILVAPPIRRHLKKGVAFARTHLSKGTHITTALLENQIRKRISEKRISHAIIPLGNQIRKRISHAIVPLGNQIRKRTSHIALRRGRGPSQVEKPKLQEQQVLKSSHTGRTRRVTKSSQAKPQTQQPSSPVTSTLPSFDCSRQNEMYGGIDQCLICANLIDCTYRRNKPSELEVGNKSRAPRLSVEVMPLEEAVAS
jgi:hypothetical protein